MGHIKFYYKKLKACMEEFERSKGKGKEKFEDAATIVQESSSYKTELLIVKEENNAYSDARFWIMFVLITFVARRNNSTLMMLVMIRLCNWLMAIVWILLEKAL